MDPVNPVSPVSPSLVDRALGLDIVRTGPALRWRRPAAPETPAAKPAGDQVSFSAAKGQVPAVGAGIQQAFSAEAQAAFGAPGVRAGGKVAARPKTGLPGNLGEDFARIALASKTEPELKALVQDSHVLAMAEMALLEPGQRQLERDIRSWIGLGKPAETPEDTEIEVLKLGLGAKISGFSREELAIQPNVDIVRIRGGGIDDLSLSAGVPINLAGQVHVRAQVQYQQGLAPDSGRYLESRARYDSQDHELQLRLGLRQRLSEDQSVSLYGQQTVPFDSRPLDLGVGMAFSQRW